jgi:hypothetical protein
VAALPEITVVIPHYNGVEILRDCLRSLYDSTALPLEVILVDNASSDGSVRMIRAEFPEVHVLSQIRNLGFAGGCNAGIRAAQTPYVLILNNDTIHQAGWLELLLEKIKSQSNIAAVQPKILSWQNRAQYDYSGAAGGEMDIFGFPFARGRIFENIETDNGQYDNQPDRIFWASGTALLARREFLLKAGLFDETFFAHMEEIDLQWRLQLMGHVIAVEPRAVIWHRSGFTLGAEAPLKKYLNHRNSLLMFLTNYKPLLTAYLLPIRILLDWMALAFSLLKFDFGRAGAILKAHGWILVHPRIISRRRRLVKELRRVPDTEIMQRLYRGSVALGFYLFRKNYSDFRK